MRRSIVVWRSTAAGGVDSAAAWNQASFNRPDYPHRAMAAPLQRARLQFGKGTGALQGRLQWLPLPVASLRDLASLVARQAKVPAENVEFQLQDCLLPIDSDPRLIRDGETIRCGRHP